MNKLNILQLISSLDVGGAEKLLIDLLNASKETLGEVDYTVVVMNDQVNEDFKTEILNTGYDVHFFNRPQGHKHPKYLLDLLDIIKKKNIKIIHSHNNGSKFWSILCKLLNPRVKTVYTVHDTNIISTMNKLELFIQKLFIDMNIAISQSVEDECKQFGVDNVIKIYNGINTTKFKQEKQTKNINPFKIINIARITHRKKGQDVLIRALKICKDKGMEFACDFVGGVYEYDKESFTYLTNLVKELELEDSINFLGNRKDIPDLLSQSDLFILPSRYEGLGLVVLEAMASKTPVVVSNIDGPAELVQNKQNGLLFESENHIDLADKIYYLCNNREKMQELADKAYKYVQDFDISIMCKNYYKLYKELMR